MSDKIVEAFNIFIDTDKGTLNPASSGADYEMNLGNSRMDIRKGQHLRLKLINFSMNKSFTNINKYNDQFVFKTTQNTTPLILELPNNNYKTIRALMEAFATLMPATLLAYSIAEGGLADAVDIVYITPSPTDTVEGNSDNFMRFKYVFKVGGVPTPHSLTGVKLQFVEELEGRMSDAYSVLGGDRVRGVLDAGDNTSNSYNIDETTDPNEVSFTSWYPAMRMSESSVYLHTDLGGSTKTLESTSLNAGLSTTRANVSQVHSSGILAKIPIDVEFIHFDTQSGGNEYFIDLFNIRHLNDIRFRLTNSHGVPLFRLTETQHAVDGNLNFNMVLRVEILEKSGQDEIHTAPFDRGIDPKLSSQATRGGGLGVW
jgi:hypothetical protein